jgi:Concanavalin A-like lectin/glucanases superfamily
MILFVIAFQLGLALITYLFTPSRNPTLVNGVRGGSSKKTISQDPKVSTNQVILRSNDQASGIEYTWSVWLRVDDIRQQAPSNADKFYSHVFHKGNEDRNAQSTNNGDIAKVNNSPGLYLRADNTNKEFNAMTFIQDVVSPVGGAVMSATQVDVSNIPMKKWFHSAFRLQNKTLDVYINGQIVSRNAMQYMPKQNYDDIFVGGFPGSISDLKYFDRALTIFEINSIVNQGPNLTTNDDSSGDTGQYDYLSRLWYNV